MNTINLIWSRFCWDSLSNQDDRVGTSVIPIICEGLHLQGETPGPGQCLWMYTFNMYNFPANIWIIILVRCRNRACLNFQKNAYYRFITELIWMVILCHVMVHIPHCIREVCVCVLVLTKYWVTNLHFTSKVTVWRLSHGFELYKSPHKDGNANVCVTFDRKSKFKLAVSLPWLMVMDFLPHS